MRLRRAAAFGFLLALVAASSARAADEEPSTTPYRPSVSTPAALSAPGWLEIEAGWQHNDGGGGARRDSIPTTFKVAFDENWGVRLGSEVWVRQRADDAKKSGFGDTGIVLKRRFAVDDDQAFGLEAGVVVPTAKTGLGFGSGKPDYAVNAIWSADFGDRWHTDVNVLASRLGQADPGASRTQWLFAASLSRQLDDRWGVVGELSGTAQSGVEDSRQLLLAASYNVSKRLTLDAGGSRSVRKGDSSWSAFAGFTWLAARLF
jgi:hypothetical protein